MPTTISWELKGGRVLGPSPFLVAGIVNVTPDSFYDGGERLDPEKAVEHGLRLAREGADILDVGGESTRPGAARVDAEEEAARTLPVLKGLGQALQGLADVPGRSGRPALSIDTYKADVAASALEAGAEIVNDVSAFRFDPALLDVLVQHKPGYVLMHSLGRPEDMQDNPRYVDPVGEILEFFEERLGILVKKGVPEERIVLDPGIGFGKLLEHNLEILKNVFRFQSLGRPVYVGLSNKSLWQSLLGLAKEDRLMATQAATALVASRGAGIHRVHEVAETVRTLTIVQEIG